MESTQKRISIEVLPWLVVNEDGTLQRVAGTETCAPGFDPETQVLSKDIVIEAKTPLSARIYRPDTIQVGQRLPLVVYFHGGAFLVSSAADPKYHTSLNKLVKQAHIIAVSVNYRLAPEHPLPTAYEDSWNALQWIRHHMILPAGTGNEPWINDFADFDRFFLVGDSAGANIAHHMSFRAKQSDQEPDQRLKIRGIGMIHPYFWGSKPIGSEINDEARKAMVDMWWRFVCPSEKGSDDPWINPYANGSPAIEEIGCERVLVAVAEKDILRDRGKEYDERLRNSGWSGRGEMVETKGKDHVFHIFEPDSDEAKEMIGRFALFINQEA